MTIAVTGASGFIGARLVEMLAIQCAPAQLRVLSRRRTSAADCRVVDLSAPTALAEGLKGCDAVVHCAFDFFDIAENVAIARAMAYACVAVGARLVHVSTAAIYEPFPDGILDETVSAEQTGSDYKRVKLAIETELLGHVRDAGLNLVILQPTIVYGPRGGAWTDSPVRELLTGIVVLPDEGRGLCNAVYIDDVCQAAIAALTAPVPSGERILVSGSHPVMWKEFYGAYQDILRVQSLQLATSDTSADAGVTPLETDGSGPTVSALSRKALIKRLLARMLGTQARSQLNMLVSFLRSLALGRSVHRPAGAKLALFRARCDVRIDKAKRLLNYEPQFDLQRGMQMTAAYVLRTYGTIARLQRRKA